MNFGKTKFNSQEDFREVSYTSFLILLWPELSVRTTPHCKRCWGAGLELATQPCLQNVNFLLQKRKGKMDVKATTSNLPWNVFYQTLFYALQTCLCTFRQILQCQSLHPDSFTSYRAPTRGVDQSIITVTVQYMGFSSSQIIEISQACVCCCLTASKEDIPEILSAVLKPVHLVSVFRKIVDSPSSP